MSRLLAAVLLLPMAARAADIGAKDDFWGFELRDSGFSDAPALRTGNVKQLLALEKKMGGDKRADFRERLTLFVEEPNERMDAAKCLETMLTPHIEGARDVDRGDKPTPYRIFNLPFPEDTPGELHGYVSRHAYAYWARDYQCFELHLSLLFDPRKLRLASADEEFRKTIEALRFKAEAPGMVRAAILNRMSNPPKEINDPSAYIVLGGMYLHEAKLPDKAILYYERAERLGLPEPYLKWLAEEGIGFSYLTLGKTKEAAPHFFVALRLAEKGSKPPKGSPLPALGREQARESSYNLACAQSRNGDNDLARRSLEKDFKLLKKDRGALAREKQKVLADSDFESLRSSSGFKAWLDNLSR